MCNCFLGNAENFMFDPKCKPSDTPDCDWHVSERGGWSLNAKAIFSYLIWYAVIHPCELVLTLRHVDGKDIPVYAWYT